MLGSMQQVAVLLVSLLCSLVSLGLAIIVIIEAFKDSILEGILCILCGLYLLYYSLFKFEHDKKWLIVSGIIIFSAASYGLRSM